MKQISELIPDIYSLVQTRGWFHDDLATDLANNVSARLQSQFEERTQRPTLRLSQMGPRCPCALWYSIHHPELGEAMPPWAEIKFSYGHILEAYVIALAKAAGHDVRGEQGHVELDGIVGHVDCIIDGCVVDVKSSSSRSFSKFRDKTISKDDPFGYLDQLDGYVVGSYLDPNVTVKDRGYLLPIDKQLGHMCLYEHYTREHNIRQRVDEFKRIVSRNTPPECTCQSIEHGKSGNKRLDVKSSYNTFKYCCKPFLRTFVYSDGPVFLTHVERVPDVPEVDRYGNAVYH